MLAILTRPSTAADVARAARGGERQEHGAYLLR